LRAGVFIGLFLAEGTTCPNGSSVAFALHERERYIVAFLKAYALKQFAAPMSSKVQPGTHGQVARFSSAVAHSLLAQMGKGRQKQLPWWLLLSAPEEFLRGVLRGWLIGDV
jgi:hypothetical protein